MLFTQNFTLPIDSIEVWKWKSEVAQLCLTLRDPMDCSLPGFSVHGIFQARVLEWVAISFSRGSFRPRDRTQVSCIAGRCFTVWATREAHWGAFFQSVVFASELKLETIGNKKSLSRCCLQSPVYATWFTAAKARKQPKCLTMNDCIKEIIYIYMCIHV